MIEIAANTARPASAPAQAKVAETPETGAKAAFGALLAAQPGGETAAPAATAVPLPVMPDLIADGTALPDTGKELPDAATTMIAAQMQGLRGLVGTGTGKAAKTDTTVTEKPVNTGAGKDETTTKADETANPVAATLPDIAALATAQAPAANPALVAVAQGEQRSPPTAAKTSSKSAAASMPMQPAQPAPLSSAQSAPVQQSAQQQPQQQSGSSQDTAGQKASNASIAAQGAPVAGPAPASDSVFSAVMERVADKPAVTAPSTPDAADPAMAAFTLQSPVSTDAAPVSAPAPHRGPERIDFATLVDSIARAREDASTGPVSVALSHSEFGKVSLSFNHRDDGLSVTMTSADPAFAPAVAAASETGTGTMNSDTPRGDAQTTARGNAQSATADGRSPNGGEGGRQDQSRSSQPFANPASTRARAANGNTESDGGIFA